MKLTARARANQLNAKRSTGPRTSAGKARVAGNALRHGLAIPIAQTPGAEARVVEMARAIAGEDGDAVRLELARRVAEAQLDLTRVREERRRLLEDPKARLKKLSTRQTLRNAMKILRHSERILATPDDVIQQDAGAIEAFGKMQRLISERDAPPPAIEEGLGNLAPQLLRLERYERRATSRRNRAMRAYDAYCASQDSSSRTIEAAATADNAAGAGDGDRK